MIVRDLLLLVDSQQPTTHAGKSFVNAMHDQLLDELSGAVTEFRWWGHGVVGNLVDWSKAKWVEPTGDLNEFWKPDK